MQIPIMNGIYTDSNADIRTSYPVNLMPIPKDSGISKGYLRPADGIIQQDINPYGTDRGAITWNGEQYRIFGTKLCKIMPDGSYAPFGDIPGSGQVAMDYSFDKLAIVANGNLYYWDGTIRQVTDPDLGTGIIDVIWVDGYFMVTDGTSLIVTELNDPEAVDPLKYGSSEVDPDSIKALLKLHDEVYALNRNTIEVFSNIGGEGFPFQRIPGAQIQKGAIGTHACCLFAGAIAFLGSGRNEAPAIYLGANSQAQKISTREIDQLLKTFTEDQLSKSILENRVDSNNNFLYVHLPDRTIVYDFNASNETGEQVWFYLTSSTNGFSQYRGRNFIWSNNKWWCGDPTSSAYGYLDGSLSAQYGNTYRWEFQTMMIYNESKGAIINELELVSLTGRVEFGSNPQISTSYSFDGEVWSDAKTIAAGVNGNLKKRIVWFRQGIFKNFRIQRFNGDSTAHVTFVRLEAQIEALSR